MALVNIDAALKDVMKRVGKCACGEAIEVLSYKRNRGITVQLKEAGGYFVMERGYVEREVECGKKDLQKLLRGMFKLEFPRSRKVRIYRIQAYSGA